MIAGNFRLIIGMIKQKAQSMNTPPKSPNIVLPYKPNSNSIDFSHPVKYKLKPTINNEPWDIILLIS